MYSWKLLRERPVGFGTPVAIKLPGAPHLFDHVEVYVGDDEIVLILAADGEEVSARIDDIRGAVELADVPRRFSAYAVRGGDEVSVRDRVRRLLELPQILREARDRRRRIEDDLRAVEA